MQKCPTAPDLFKTNIFLLKYQCIYILDDANVLFNNPKKKIPNRSTIIKWLRTLHPLCIVIQFIDNPLISPIRWGLNIFQKKLCVLWVCKSSYRKFFLPEYIYNIFHSMVLERDSFRMYGQFQQSIFNFTSNIHYSYIYCSKWSIYQTIIIVFDRKGTHSNWNKRKPFCFNNNGQS